MRKYPMHCYILTNLMPFIEETFKKEDGWKTKKIELVYMREIWLTLAKDGIETMDYLIHVGKISPVPEEERKNYILNIKKAAEKEWKDLKKSKLEREKKKRQTFSQDLANDIKKAVDYLREYDKVCISDELTKRDVDFLKDIIKYTEVPF